MLLMLPAVKCALVPLIWRGNLFYLCRNGIGKGSVFLSGFHLQPGEKNMQKSEPVFGVCSHLIPDMHTWIQLTFV